MGKNNKWRACPALGREISRAECGEGRHATIACPPGCTHDLFAAANYESLLAAETRLDRRTTAALAAEIGAHAVLRAIDEATARGGDPAANAAMVVELFIRRDAAGRSFAERWLAAGAPGLDKDERVFFTGKARMRVALVEILEVRSDGLLRAVDLLEPAAGEILVLDRRTWARATRYQVLLVWVYPLPHFWRMCGGGSIWPEWPGCGLSPAEALGELVAHAGGPAAGAPLATLRDWLAVHFQDFPAKIGAVTDARLRATLESMDAVSAWSDYALSPAESKALAARLARAEADEVYRGDLSENEKATGFTAVYDVCLPPEPGGSAEQSELLGRVLRRGTTWRIEAAGRAKWVSLKARFFELSGVPAREPEREMSREIGRQQAEKITPPDEAAVPPRLLKNLAGFQLKSYRLHRPSSPAGKTPEDIARSTLEEAQNRWLDAPLPALDGRTPREAVQASPALRAQVVNLVKGRFRDYDNACLRGMFLPDPQALASALGLAELGVPAPPPRPCPPELVEEDEDVEHGGPTAGPGLEPLPDRPLDHEEVIRRLVQVQNHFPTDDDLLDAWVASCASWADEVCHWGKRVLDPQQLEDLVVGLALAWAALGGADRPSVGHRLNGQRLRAGFDSAWDCYDVITDEEELRSLFNTMNPSQPALQQVIEVRLEVDAKSRKGGLRSLRKVHLALAAWLDVAVPEITRVLAEPQ